MTNIRGKKISLHERREINRLLREKFSLGKIAKKIGRSKTTIVSEVRRNGGAESYNAVKAEARAVLMKNKRLSEIIQLSPYQRLDQRIQNLEMQVEILVDAIKELSHED